MPPWGYLLLANLVGFVAGGLVSFLCMRLKVQELDLENRMLEDELSDRENL